MIAGIGVDMVQVVRLERGLQRFGQAYAQRILAPEEQDAFLSSKDPARFLAKRFAAKEAFAKAAGTGLRDPVQLQNIAIRHTALGQPYFSPLPELADWLARSGISAHHLSISDEQAYVVAFAVLEK